MCHFALPICLNARVSQVGEFLLLPNRELPHAAKTQLYFPKLGGRGSGVLCCGVVGGTSPVCLCRKKKREKKRAIRSHICESLSGLMTSDVKERSDEIPPHPPIQSARWRKRQAGPTLTEKKKLRKVARRK